MMLILLVLNLPALARMILRRPSPEIAMPNDQDDKRSPKETAQLARDVMRRMIEAPPKPHEKLTKKKKSRRR